jgi:hypothetical protein
VHTVHKPHGMLWGTVQSVKLTIKVVEAEPHDQETQIRFISTMRSRSVDQHS